METATNPKKLVIAARNKAVLKHAQSKRWREVRCGHANAERLDCVRFIAAFPASARQGRRPSSEAGLMGEPDWTHLERELESAALSIGGNGSIISVVGLAIK